MIKFDVKNRFTGKVQFTAEIDCAEDASTSVKLGLAVRWALKARANLTGANLANATLTGATLTRANLSGANLFGANLTGANLTRANLSGANLAGAKGLDLPPPDLAEARIRQIAEIVTSTPDALDMSDWHKCETTHCIAGWAVHLAGEEGARLEKERGPAMAGMALLGLEAASHFYDSTADATAWLRSKLEHSQ